MLRAGAQISSGPTASIFGQSVVGQAATIGQRVPGAPGLSPTSIVEWVAESGNRLWIVPAEQASPAARGAQGAPAFGAGITLTSPNTAEPTTVGSRPAAGSTSVPSAATAAALPWPHWWSGTCNVNNYPPGYLLTTGGGTLSGLEVCAPSSSTLGGSV